MHHILKSFILFLGIFSGFVYSQEHEKIKEKTVKKITGTEYRNLKKQGKLSDQFIYIIDNGKTIPFNATGAKPASPQQLTSCDPLPTQGPLGYSVEVDDSPLATVPLQFNFCFYGTTYNSLNLSANGNVQFSTNSTAFSSTGFPSNTVNMIAPFWADGETMVPFGGRTYGKIYIDSHPTYIIISWDSLGYFNGHVDKLNSFQLVLTNGSDPILPVGKNVGFYYKQMQWTTGDASSGLNGFPNPSVTPAIPATIGANQGNGIDYFLIGLFGTTGTVYDGPGGNIDGISWLDGKRFFFDVCPPVGSNQAPAATLIGPCDTVKVCGNDTLIIKNAFIGPELTQSVSVTASAPTLGSSFSYSVLTSGNNTDISMTVNGNTAPAGYHIVTMTATDNGTPSLTSSQSLIVFIDHSSVNSLNGQIVLTPTIGICPGGVATASIVTSGAVPTSYLWNNNASTTSTSYTMTPALDSLVYVTIKNGQCQKTIRNFIRVNPVPVPVISGNTYLCSGTSTTAVLTASNTLNYAAQAPYTYTWTGSPISPSPVNTQTTNATGGTYSVTIMNKYNCIASAAVTVTLVPTPVFTVVPTNTTICFGASVPLSINFGTITPTSCGLANTGCTSASTSTIGTGTSTNGSSSYPTPYSNYYRSQHFQMLFRASELTAAGVVAGKISGLAFNISTLNSFNVPLPNYTIKIKCTNAVSLNSSFDNTGLNQVYFSSSYMPANGVNTHNFNQAYVWDGVSNILIDICYDRIPGNYVSNGSTSAYYTTTAFTSVIYDRSDSYDLCSSTDFSSTSSNRPNVRFFSCSANPSINEYTFLWTPGTYLSSSSAPSPTCTPASSIQYSVVVTPTAAVTCSNSATATVNVINPVTPTISAVAPMCSNASQVTMTVTPAGGAWLGSGMSSAGVLTPSAAVIGTNTYSYALGSGTCAASNTVAISIERYVPSTITGSINPLCITNPAVNLSTALSTSTLGAGVWSGNGVTGTMFDPSIAGAGVHTLVYSTNSVPTVTLCPSASSINVSVSSVTQPTITAAGPYCDNFAPQVLNVTPSGGLWSSTTSTTAITPGGVFTPAGGVIGANKVLYTLTSGPCVAKDSIIVDVVKFVPATLSGLLGPYCIYDPMVSLQPIAQYSGGVWSGNGVTGSDFTPALAGAGAHTITYNTDPAPSGLCPDQATTQINVNAKPEANAVPDIITGCNPLTVNYQTTTVNTGTAKWNFGDGSPVEAGFMVAHTYTVPGVYTAVLSYTDNAGCLDTTNAVSAVTVYSVPVAAFDANPDITTVVDGEVSFQNNTSSISLNTYQWSFGTADVSTDVNPTYLYTNSGEFFVTLIATSPEGCIDTAVKKVTINPDVVLYVPNAFTPGNGDGLNDVLEVFLPPTGVDFSTFSLTIYDRWGSVVYKTNDVTQFWNGARNNSGELLKQDVYVYKITFEDMKKKYFEKVGHVSLLRK